jgi:two-component system, NarL family, sensor kinase
MKYYKILAGCFIACMLTAGKVPAQVSSTDSLQSLIRTEKDATKKAELQLKLSTELREINPDNSFSLSQEVIKTLGKKNKELHMKADLNAVFYYVKRSKADTGLALADKNIVILTKELKNDSLLAQFQSQSGHSLMKLNRKKEALERFYGALKSAEKAKDIITQAKALHQIGWAYMELKQYEEAIKFFTASIQLLVKNNLPANYPTTYNNMASCYGALGKLDSAFKYVDIGIRTAAEKKNLAAEANGWFIKGYAYMEQKKYEDAMKSFLTAKPLRAKAGDPFFIVSDLAVISELYALMGKTKEGIQTGNEALQIAEKEKIEAKYTMIYKAMAMNYEAAGDFKMASDIYKKMAKLQDKIYNDASQGALAEMKTKYETEKKERIIQEQQFNLKRKNLLIGFIALLVVAGSLLGWLFYNRSRLKQEAKLQATLLEQEQMAASAVLHAEENERQRIAKDLHDGVGQMMSAAKMNLSAFENEMSFKTEEQKLSFARIISLVDESCKEVRTVSHQMMPNMLLKSGLAKAVADFIDKIDQKVIKINLHTEGLNERIEENTEIVLYRVLQESVNNVIKHSGATELDIALIKDEDGISATIEDNGHGFDAKNLSEKAGIGLKNMKARVEYLKGTIDFDSSPGSGTLVAIHIPANKETV